MFSRISWPLQFAQRCSATSAVMSMLTRSPESVLKGVNPLKNALHTSSATVIPKRNHSSTSSAPPAQHHHNLKLVKLTDKDLHPVMDFFFDDFIKNEPLSNALNLNKEEAFWLYETVILSTINSPFSYAFQDEDGKPVAMRLCTVIDRPLKQEEHGIFFDLEALVIEKAEAANTKSYEIIRILAELETKIWRVVGPEMNRLLHVVAVSCHQDWTRHGIMGKLLECDLDVQKKIGIQGAVAEATSYSAQRLMAKSGYKPVYDVQLDKWFDENGQPVFKCKDETTCAQLFYKKY